MATKYPEPYVERKSITKYKGLGSRMVSGDGSLKGKGTGKQTADAMHTKNCAAIDRNNAKRERGSVLRKAAKAAA